MTRNILNKINFLTSDSTILVIGELENNLRQVIENTFKKKEYYDFTGNSFEILNNNLYERFDIIIFIFNVNSYKYFEENMIKVPDNSIFIIDENLYEKVKQNINLLYSLLINPISDEILLNKIYGLLSIKETTNLLKTKEKIFNKYQNNSENKHIDEFLEVHSGSIIFINDDLNEKLDSLNNLEISQELFSQIALSLTQLSNILKEEDNLKYLASLFADFALFLDELNLKSIKPSNYEAFDYLTKIIEDITLYLNELFVYKLFKDTKIIEDSLKNNIEYLKNELQKENDTKDSNNLEFF